MGESKPALPVLESGSGSAVVFLHGYPLDHRMWGSNPGRFLPNRRVILVDLPGFGLAESHPSPDTMHGFSEAVAQTLLERAVGPATIVGHSMGGYIALQLHQDHPDRISRLVLANTRSGADTPEARRVRLETVGRLRRPGEALNVDEVVRSLLAPDSMAAHPEVVESVRMMIAAARSERVVPTLTALAGRPDYTSGLPRIAVPTLVIWGSSDRLIPPAHSKAMLSSIRGAQGFEVQGAAHLPSLESPVEFYRKIQEFLPISG